MENGDCNDTTSKVIYNEIFRNYEIKLSLLFFLSKIIFVIYHPSFFVVYVIDINNTFKYFFQFI